MKINEITMPDLSDKQKLNDAYKTISTREDITWDVLEEKLSPERLELVKHFIKPENSIYRGMKDTGSIVVGSGKLLNRKSANTFNYYTLILDVLPSWEHMPRRSQSFICSSSPNGADGYGSRYRVIPLENQEIAIAPKSDFWVSFKHLGEISRYIEDLDSFNRYLHTVTAYIHKKYDFPYDVESIPTSSTNDMIKYLYAMDNFFKNDYDPSDIDNRQVEQLYDNIKHHGSFLDVLDTAFNPEFNDFRLTSARYYSNPGKLSEIWLSGKVMFIRNDIVEKLNETA